MYSMVVSPRTRTRLMPFKKQHAKEDANPNSRFWNWIWTLNNYTEAEEHAITEWHAKYLVFGREIGTKKGTPHLQGFVMWHSVKSFKQLKELNPRISWRVAKTTVEAAAYCKKDGDYYESGTAPKGSGKRSDLETAYELARSGKTLKDACDAGLSFQAIRAFEKARSVYPREARVPVVQWFFGPSGSGKTREAIAQGAYMVEYGDGKFSSFDGHEHIVLDDIDHRIPPQLLLKVMDRYNVPLNVKCAEYTPASWQTLTITSTWSPAEFWNLYTVPTGALFQLERRITHIRYFGEFTEMEL